MYRIAQPLLGVALVVALTLGAAAGFGQKSEDPIPARNGVPVVTVSELSDSIKKEGYQGKFIGRQIVFPATVIDPGSVPRVKIEGMQTGLLETARLHGETGVADNFKAGDKVKVTGILVDQSYGVWRVWVYQYDVQPRGDKPAGPVKPVPGEDRYRAYWLVAPSGNARTEYQRLLVTSGPVEELAGVKSGSKSLFDNAAMTFRTYKRDSLWEDPFRTVQQFDAVDEKAKTVVVDGTTYLYEPCLIGDVVALLEKPEGTIPIHRRVHPLSGAKQTAKAFRLLLQGQMKHEK